MPLWIVVLLAAILLLAPWGSLRLARRGAETDSLQAAVTVKKIKSLSRSSLIALLGRVKTSQAPPPRMGAMCYETMAVYERVDYICPHCGEKTIYPSGDKDAYELLALAKLDREFDLFRKQAPLKMAIEENGYCKHCASGSRPRGVTLVVTYEDGATHRCFPFNINDLNRLKALLSDQLAWNAGNDSTKSLKEDLPRLQELLGVKLEDRF
jgi:hypothetical protein